MQGAGTTLPYTAPASHRESESESHSVVSTLMDCKPSGSSIYGNLQARNTGVGCHFLLQGIFQTQGWSLGLLCCGQTIYHLSHQGSFSCCEAPALGHVGFNSCGSCSQAPEHTGSVAVVHGLSFSEACGIFLDQGLNPYLLHWQADSLPLSHQGSLRCVI